MAKGSYITERQVKRKLGKLLRSYWSKSRRTYAGFADRQFYLPTAGEVRAFLDAHPIPAELHSDEVFDCDDYAFVLKGLVCLHARSMKGVTSSMCLGIAWEFFDWAEEGFHAANWVLQDDGEFLWIEPQGATLHELEECQGGLTLVLA